MARGKTESEGVRTIRTLAIASLLAVVGAAFYVHAAGPTEGAASIQAASGRALFERNWTIGLYATSPVSIDNGLGPLFNEGSCAVCHQSIFSFSSETIAPGTVIRFGNFAGTGDSVYGAQLQTWGVSPNLAEAEPAIEWIAQGQLRIARVSLFALEYGALTPSTKVGLRRAPSLAGVGLLAQVPEAEILSRADQKKSNVDGVHGRGSWLSDGNGTLVLGRFGWKATQPTLTLQTAAAFSRDMGLSTTNFPEPWGDCTQAERACRANRRGTSIEGVEVEDAIRDQIVAYLDSLVAPSVPASNRRGSKLFELVNCSACHATLHLADGKAVTAYTDLLLHRMGPGLDDGIKEGAAEAGEWRTAPLWDVRSNLKAGGLLHDGRARTVAEAIEWHGGEAVAARTRFQALSAPDKAALIAFVSGL